MMKGLTGSRLAWENFTEYVLDCPEIDCFVCIASMFYDA